MVGHPNTDKGAGRFEEEEIIRQVVKAISSVRFGQVQIIIQDSRVVQIDKTEKVRLAYPPERVTSRLD